jgi:hypothetical protein
MNAGMTLRISFIFAFALCLLTFDVERLIQREKDTSGVAQSHRTGRTFHAFDDFLLRSLHGGMQLTL